MVGKIPPQRPQDLLEQVSQIFGGWEERRLDSQALLSQIAVVGAMTNTLVRLARARGADLYLTGQFRQPAAGAVQETQVGVITIGHDRSEQWGLGELATIICQGWPGLEVILAPGLGE